MNIKIDTSMIDNENAYVILNELYKRKRLNIFEVELFYLSLRQARNYIKEHFRDFLNKHIEITIPILYRDNLFDLFDNTVLHKDAFNNLHIKENIKTDVTEKAKFFKQLNTSTPNFLTKNILFIYDSIFNHFTESSNYIFWINHIDLTMLLRIFAYGHYCSFHFSITYQRINQQKKLAEQLRKFNLIDKLDSPIHNFILLGVCGLKLTNKELVYLYQKCNIVFSEEFHDERFKNRLKGFGLNKLNVDVFDNRFIYNLLKLRDEKIPEELKHIYLMGELKDEFLK